MSSDYLHNILLHHRAFDSNPRSGSILEMMIANTDPLAATWRYRIVHSAAGNHTYSLMRSYLR